MAPTKSRVTLYTVRRVNWEYNDDYFDRFDEEGEFALPFPVPAIIDDTRFSRTTLLAFLTPEKAHEYCLQRERLQRGDQNPFEFGSDGRNLHDYTRLPGTEFVRRLQNAGITPPVLDAQGRSGRRESLLEWFARQNKRSPEQTHTIWDALDRIQFFHVVPLEVDLEVDLGVDPVPVIHPRKSPYQNTTEAKRPVPPSLHLIERRLWCETATDLRIARPLFMPKMTRTAGYRKGLVQMVTYCPEEGYLPVRAFGDPYKAEAFCHQCETEAWVGINPFRYGNTLPIWTSLDSGRLRDRLLDIGLEPPSGKFSVSSWQKWFDTIGGQLTELERLELRQALDRQHFYRVRELTA